MEDSLTPEQFREFLSLVKAKLRATEKTFRDDMILIYGYVACRRAQSAIKRKKLRAARMQRRKFQNRGRF